MLSAFLFARSVKMDTVRMSFLSDLWPPDPCDGAVPAARGEAGESCAK
jgi:hypothetical protein